MKKSELAIILESQHKLSGALATRVVNKIFASMFDALNRGENIYIRGFGSMMVRRYRPYIGRNPKTGESVRVQRRRLPLFIMSTEILRRMNKGSTREIRPKRNVGGKHK